ncbi:MAG: TonB-dependent receptor [Acidobacteria bacterium]|nr:TonB-dependent receptor [Acidobacteriota bacterium]
MKLRSVILLFLGCAVPPGWAERPPQAPRPYPDLTEMSLEELANIEVTSVARKGQKLSQAAAAVYVITLEDIRRSGATSIPEALRLAPGLDVARVDSNKWAISSRGFNGQYSNKMLVLIDGRSVYSLLFSGVYWDSQDLMLEDVERIEVIRGPGATVWGANAVNGVINIISKHSRETQGGLATIGGGNEEGGFGSARYGGPLGAKGYYRVYSKFFRRSALLTESGSPAADDWHALRGGFRMDWELTEQDSLTLEGDLYGGRNGQTLTAFSLEPPYSQTFDDHVAASGSDLLTRWGRRFSSRSEAKVQFYYDRYQRRDAVIGETRNTVDFDLQHRFTLSSRHEIVWGLGYRFSTDRTEDTVLAKLQPARRGLSLYSFFVQDEIALVPERLRLTVGSKFEHNDFTGFEIQPALRVLWTPHQRHAAWASVARAVRTPSRGEQDGRLNVAAFPGPGGTPVLVAFIGSGKEHEDLVAYEAGYRFQPSSRVSLDLAAFYNQYTHLSQLTLHAPLPERTPAPPHLVLPAHPHYATSGRTYGTEIAARWSPAERWRWSASFTAYSAAFPQGPAGQLLARPLGGETPRQQFQIHSYLDLTRRIQWDTGLYQVQSLKALQIPSYARLDTRLGWRLGENVDLSLGLQNLLNDRHAEFISEVLVRKTEIGRSVYGKVTWRF